MSQDKNIYQDCVSDRIESATEDWEYHYLCRVAHTYMRLLLV